MTEPTYEELEIVARAICDVWGYVWDGDPDEDDQVAPEKEGVYDERPSKQMYRDAARTAIKALDEYRAAEAPNRKD